MWLFKNPLSTVILTLRSAIVPYCLSKGFIIVENEEAVLYPVPVTVQNQINVVYLDYENSLLICKSKFSRFSTHRTKLSYPEMCITLMFQVIMMNFVFNVSRYILNLLLNSVWNKMNILPLSWSGQAILRNLCIRKNKKIYS